MPQRRPTECSECSAPITQDPHAPARFTCSNACRKRRFRARAAARRRQALVEALQAIETGAPRERLVDVLTSALSA